MPPILLLTRPPAQSDRFAAEAARSLPPHQTLVSPLTEVVGLSYDPAVFDGARALVLTSASALPFLPPLPPGLPAFCVGAATARAARAAGFDAIEGGGDAAALIATLQRLAPEGPLVHAHGADVAHPIPGTRAVAVYDAVARDLNGAARMALCGQVPVLAPLFSPRAARLFAAQPGVAEAAVLRLVAISAACAAALPPGWPVRVARSPDSGGMLHALSQVMTPDAPTG